MTNLICDFRVGWPVGPHMGFGVGAVDIIDSVSLNPVVGGPITVRTPGGALVGAVPAGATFGGPFLKGNGWAFGYQAIAGFRYDIHPRPAFDLAYRSRPAPAPPLPNTRVFPFPPLALPSSLASYQ